MPRHPGALGRRASDSACHAAPSASNVNFLAGSAVLPGVRRHDHRDGPDLFTPTAGGDPTPSDSEIPLF